jgi:hypothetical protein
LDGSPKLSIGVPSHIPYRPIWANNALRSLEGKKFISVALSKYVEFWKQGIDQNTTYAMKMASYVEYWEDILLHFSKPLPLQSSTLLEVFWLSSNRRSNYARASLPTRMEVADAEDLTMHPYCGPKNLKPFPAYTPFKDLNNGDFVPVRPHDPLLIPMWMGRTQCDVVKDEQNEFFKMVRV